MEPPLAFSVIIPLEFHRGLAEKCIRGWAGGQTFPRSHYEIIVAAPDDHPVEELNEIRSILSSHDRLLMLPLRHDIDLIAEGSRQARGEVLVYTESHCLPEPDLLTLAHEVLEREPGLAGFSGIGIPITHNLLSQIEGEMYVADMKRQLEDHPWLKVMDANFAIRRKALQECGGLEPHYGHFAEWILAARLRQCGLKIGYQPAIAVHHFYIGELDDLVEFTDDFARGQMRFALKRGQDPAVPMFEAPALWLDRWSHAPKVARAMALLMWRDRNSPATDEEHESRRKRWWEWALRSFAGPTFEIRKAAERMRMHRTQIAERLAAEDKEGARNAFLQLMEACVDHCHLLVIRDEWKAEDDEAIVKFAPKEKSGRWSCGDEVQVIKTGILSNEEVFGKAMSWTAPEAMIWLPIGPGKYEIHVDWIGFSQMPTGGRYRFYIDERAVPLHHQLELPHGMLIQAEITSSRGVRLAWTCAPFRSPGDTRLLGMPLTGIAWKRLKKTAKLNSPRTAGAAKDGPPWKLKSFRKHAPLYFLHVEKCMGTTVRLVLENAFRARDILAPWNEFYHLHELEGLHRLRAPCRFVRGHYRSELMEAIPDRNWKVITGLRDPADRLLSKFDYMKQLGRLPESLSLERWLREEIRACDTQAGYFVHRSVDDTSTGANGAASYLRSHTDEALARLRQCGVVGLQERPEESVNLFAWATGALPPARLSRVNTTERRHFPDRLGAEATALLNDVTTVDRLLYEEGCKLFEAQCRAMLEDLRRETGRDVRPEAVRECLRARALARLEREQVSRPKWEEGVMWKPDDIFPGENLDSRERHDGISLRWTGPNEETRFHFALPPGATWDITIKLHSATPPEHARAAELWMDGHAVPLSVQWSDSGVATGLSGRITGEPSPGEKVMREFVLKSPIHRAKNDRRFLGLCLRGMELRRCAPGAGSLHKLTGEDHQV